MLKKTILLAFVISANSLFAQTVTKNENAIKYAETISAKDLKAHLEVIASDAYEGRETGKKGQKMAAEYISNYFKQLDLTDISGNNNYQQPFELNRKNALGVQLKIEGKEYNSFDNFWMLSGASDGDYSTKSILFAGYGINDESYNDYNGLDVNEKYLMVFNGEPKNKKGQYYVSGSKKSSQWSIDRFKKMREAQSKGASALFIIVEDFDSKAARLKPYLSGDQLTLIEDEKENKKEVIPLIYISKSLATKMLGLTNVKALDKIQNKISKKGSPIASEKEINIAINIKRDLGRVKSENVLGYLPGTSLKDEVLVISSHYDHIGIVDGKINNGADDDGSGTVTVLELAEAFSLASKAGYTPKRSILFITVSGEEKGLLGSDYYTRNPILPLDKTIANLNIDMVGRVDKKHESNPDYIYLIGSDKLSTQLHSISEQCNTTYSNLELDYTYNDPKDPNRYYYRSDHYNFAKNNIPVIFYFNGTHPDYHKPTDTVEKINYDKMSNVAKLIFYTAWELANTPIRPQVNVDNDFE